MIDYRKLNSGLQGAVFIAVLIVLSATAIKQPLWLLQFSTISIIFPIVLIFINLLPFGKTILGDRAKRLPLTQYVRLLLLSQLVLLLFSLTAGFAFIPMSSDLVEHFISQPHYWSWGVFPWSLFGLWGLILAYLNYVKKEYALVGNMFSFFESDVVAVQSLVKSSSEFIIFTVNIFCFILIVTAVIVLFSHFIQLSLGLGSHLDNYFITLVVIGCLPSIVLGIRWLTARFISRYPKWSQRFDNGHRHIPFIHKIMITISLMIAILVGCAYIGQWSVTYFQNAHHHSLFLYKSCGAYFSTEYIQPRFSMLFWSWGLLWVPLMGSFIAKISQGRTVRELSLGVLLGPFVLSMLFCILNYCLNFSFIENFEYFSIHVFKHNYFYLKLVFFAGFSMATVVSIIKLMPSIHNNLFFYSGFSSVPEAFKKSRTDLRWAPMLFGTKKLFKILMMGIIGLLFMYSLGGWYIISIELMVLALLILSMSAIIVIGFVFKSVLTH